MPNYSVGTKVATRQAYGETLVNLGKQYPQMVVLDAGTANSTCTELFKQAFPERFFEMYIAEQNMVGVGVGLALSGQIPFVSTFAAFLTRAHDQIRMAGYNRANLKIVGSHAGVSLGPDGVSQMGLEDLALFRSIYRSTVLYPSDAVSTQALVLQMVAHRGLCYLRTTREATPVIYSPDETFPIGGAKVIKQSTSDKVTIIAAGITLHEALKAYDELKKRQINARVIDLYSLKPLDLKTLKQAAAETKMILTVEDHYPEGGLGEAVKSALVNEPVPVFSLAVNKLPKSGTPAELLHYEEIDSDAIVKHSFTLLDRNQI